MTDRDERTSVVNEGSARTAHILPSAPAPGITTSETKPGPGASPEQSWEIVGKAPVAQTSSYRPVEVCRYFWKPPIVTMGGSFLGLTLILGQFWAKPLLYMVGFDLGVILPLLRLAMVVVGIFMLIIAAPVYRPLNWTPEQDMAAKLDQDLYRGKPAT